MNYNFDIPRPRGFIPQNISENVIKETTIKDVVLHSLIARLALNNNDNYEFQTVYDELSKKFDLNVPDYVLDLLNEVQHSDKLKKFLGWLIGGKENIKNLYESNEDTNAFTDEYKFKIDNISSTTETFSESGTITGNRVKFIGGLSNQTLILPEGRSGLEISIRNSGTVPVVVAAHASETIEDNINFILNPDESIILTYIDDDWTITSAHLDRMITGQPYSIKISDKKHLPPPIAGVITLEPDTAYCFEGTIDLLGDRLVGSSNTAILGTSSETSFITSTGLNAGTPLFTTAYTTPIRNISFNDVDTVLNIDGDLVAPSQLPALDWTGVNFVNVPNIGTIKNVDNFIYTKGAFINSQNLIIDGSIATFAANQSLFTGNGLAGDIIKVADTANITRRFRIIYSSFVVPNPAIGVNFSLLANVPNDNYILDTVNFSGDGIYISGVPYTDNRARFVGVRGVSNSGEVCNYSMLNNAVATVINSIGVAVKIAGTTTANPLNQKFSHSNNRATYVGSLTRIFQVTTTITLSSGNNQILGVYVTKNDNVVPASEIYTTTDGNGKTQALTVQAILELSTNDYVEIWVENSSSITNVVVSYMNVVVKSIGD